MQYTASLFYWRKTRYTIVCSEAAKGEKNMGMVSETILINILVDCLLGLRAEVKDIMVEAQEEQTTYVFGQYIHRLHDKINAHITTADSIFAINKTLYDEGFSAISEEYNYNLYVLSLTKNLSVGSEMFEMPHGKKVMHEALHLRITIRKGCFAGKYIVNTILCQVRDSTCAIILCLQKS